MPETYKIVEGGVVILSMPANWVIVMAWLPVAVVADEFGAATGFGLVTDSIKIPVFTCLRTSWKPL
jgi:hypothetical protein